MRAGTIPSDDYSLTLIVPTVSRPTLARTLKSVKGQSWRPNDRIIVLADGRQLMAKQLVAQLPSRFKYVECPGGPHNDWSHTPRNWLLHKIGLSTTHFAVLDDDDVWVPDALEAIHEAIRANPTHMHLFRMDGRDDPRLVGHAQREFNSEAVFWVKKEVVVGNVGTPMSVCPVDDKLGTYRSIYSGDFDFIKEESETHEVSWHEKIIAVCRPL